VLAPLTLALAGAVFALTTWPRGETQTRVTAGSVVAWREAKVTFDPARNQLSIGSGTVIASVWAEPALHLSVSGRHVEVEAAELVVRVAGDQVVIAPTEGWVLVDGERVEASRATRALAGADAAALEGQLPADVGLRRAERRAELAVEARQWDEAARALDEVGRSGTLAAEAAVLRKGELELRQLHDAARALGTFGDAAARFPEGSLGQERELSALEAEVALARWEDAATRAERFLARHPATERAVEVRTVLAQALLKLDRREAACAVTRQLPAGDAVHLTGVCP
jgi:hypothetical protein